MIRLYKNWQRGLSFVFAFLTLSTLLLNILPQKASAATAGYEILNAAEFQLKSLTFELKDTQGSDSTLDAEWVKKVGQGDVNRGISTLNDYVARLTGSGSVIWKDTNATDPNIRFVLRGCKESVFRLNGDRWEIEALHLNIPITGGCTEGEHGALRKPIPLSINMATVRPLLETAFKWVNSRTIMRIDGMDGAFVQTDPANYPNVFFRAAETGEDDQDYVELVGSNKGALKYIRDGTSEGQFNIAEVDKSDDPAEVDAAGNVITPGAADDSGAPSATCESSDGAGLSWILCPVIRGIDGILNAINSRVIDLLEIRDTTTNRTGLGGGLSDSGVCETPIGESCKTSLRGSWAIIKNIASIVLVLFALVAVAATALNFGPFDAYTIRKILPRMVAAVIIMQLSWDLMVFGIELVNDLGSGIYDLMLTPFGGAELTGFDDVVAQSGSSPGVQLLSFDLLVITLAAAGGFALGVLGVLSLALTTFVSVFIGFGILILRNILIVGTLIFAPFAIICYIMPGTEKMGKIWWETYSKGLLMFPIIMAMFAGGRIFAYLAANSGAENSRDLLQFIIVIAAYVIPYFLIPTTFKLAGGAIATLGGMANDRTRGFFDRNKKFRQGRTQKLAKERGARLKEGKIWKGSNTNKWVQRAAHLNKAADTGILRAGRDWKKNMDSAIQTTDKETQKHIMEDALFNTWAGFDDVSGLAADVLMGNTEGIRNRLLKQGVGLKTKVDENGKTVADRDADGNLQVDGAAGEAELAAKTKDVTDRIAAGDLQGALSTGLRHAGTFTKKRQDGSEYTDEAELGKNVSHFMRAQRQYGNEPLAQALVKKAAAGGTYYDNVNDAWTAAGMATAHDGAARADMAATVRSMHTNAGRADLGGASFGTTIGFMDELSRAEGTAAVWNQQNAADISAGKVRAKTAEDVRRDLKRKYTKHIIQNNPASILFHQSMKENYVEANIIPVLQENIQETAAAAQGKPKDSPEYAAYMKALADADNIYQQALATKPSLAQKIGDQIMNLQLPDTETVVRAQVKRDSGGRPMYESGVQLDASGNPTGEYKDAQPIMEYITVQVPMTVQTATGTYKTDEVWQRYHREFMGGADRTAFTHREGPDGRMIGPQNFDSNGNYIPRNVQEMQMAPEELQRMAMAELRRVQGVGSNPSGQPLGGGNPFDGPR